MKQLTTKAPLVKLYPAVALAAVLLASGVNSKATPLAPGGSLFPPPTIAPPTGTLVASLASPFGSSTLLGTLFSEVWRDTSNPFGAGDLTFTYRIELSSGSPNGVSQISVGNYDSFGVDAGFSVLAGATAPTFFSRSNEGGGRGDVLQLHFGPLALGSDELQPGHNSDLLVIRTSAANFQASTASIIDGVAVPNVATFTPLVPEPSNAALLGLGTTIALLWRRKHH